MVGRICIMSLGLKGLKGQSQIMRNYMGPSYCRANFPFFVCVFFFFCTNCYKIKICQKYCRSSPIAAICPLDISSIALEPRRDIVYFIVVISYFCFKDTHSMSDFIHAQCLGTVPIPVFSIYHCRSTT